MTADQNSIVEIRVEHHPSGSRTLTRRDGTGRRTDLCTPNKHPGEFYRFVADYLGELANRGEAFRYADGSPPTGKPAT